MIELPLLENIGYGECQKCPLSPEYHVPGFGPADGITLVGEAPGQNETRIGRPFVGVSGKLIREVLVRAGVDPETCRWTNAALCRPPGNKTPPISATSACNNRLFRELHAARPTRILSLGASALTALQGATKPLRITAWRGKGFWTRIGERNVYTVATYHPAAILRDADLFRDMVMDVQKLLREEAPQPTPEVEAWIPTTEVEALRYLEEIVSAAGLYPLSCDLETSGFDPEVDFIISVGIGYAQGTRGAAVLIGGTLLESPRVRGQVERILRQRRAYHNAKFDLKFLEKWLDTTFPADDTMLMNYTMDERPMGQFSTHGLKTLSRFRYDADDYSWDWKKFFRDPEKFSITDLYQYQALDCYYTSRLAQDFEHELDEPALLLYDTLLIPGMHALRKIERHGVPMDVEYLQKLQLQLSKQLIRISKALQDGVEKLTGEKWFNPGSPLQVKEILERLGIEVESTNKEEMNIVVRSGASEDARGFAKAILEYRNLSKLLSTYVDGFLRRVGADGRIRADFLLHGTVTGRLASRDPNLQNIPHHGGGDPEAAERGDLIRRSFISGNGCTFVEADYSQLELRVAAFYSDDQLMRETFVNRVDIHYAVASQMFRKPIEEISKQERHLAKYFDFGLVYGRGAASLAEGREMEFIQAATGVRWTVRDAEKFMQRFLGGFPQLAAWLRKQRHAPHNAHEVSTPTGRRRRFDLVLPDGLAERQAINSPIQALASDICLDALIRLHAVLPEGAHILFTVHDSIAFEIRNDLLGDVLPVIKQVMEEVRVIQTDIPFVVEMKAGPNWTDAKVIDV